MDGPLDYIGGADTLKMDRAILNCFMYWSAIAHICSAIPTPPECQNYVQGQARGPGQGEGAIMALLSADQPALDLAGLSLTAVPAEVLWHSECLTYLDVSSNALRDLPDALCTCSKLHQLNLDHNKLRCIPDAVFHLPSLRVLQARFPALPVR